MKSLYLVLLLSIAANATADDTYLVLVDPGEKSEYMPAAQALAELHEGRLKTFDTAHLEPLLDALKKTPPRFVAFVLPPQKIDVDLSHDILEMAVRVDDDPFVDFEYGFITGRDGKAASRFVARSIAARRRTPENKAALFGSWEGVAAPAAEPLPALEGLGFSAAARFVMVSDDALTRKKTAKEALTSFKGMDALLFFSHGYPDEMSVCFRAEDLKDWKVDLFPAVLVNCSCYNGAPGRWFLPGPQGMVDRGIVPPADSVALAILDSGVSAYVAGIDPWHGPLANQVFYYIAGDGMRLGEAVKRMHDRLALEFLPDRIAYGPTIERRFTGEGTDNRRHNGAGMILYGDPAHKPFEKNPASHIVTQPTENGKTRIRLVSDPMIKGGQPGPDFMLCTNRLIDYYSVKTEQYMNELRMEVYQVVPLPGDGKGTPSLDVVSVKSGERDVPFKSPQLAVEKTPDGRFLHIRVPLDISPMIPLWTFQLAKEGIVVELEGAL